MHTELTNRKIRYLDKKDILRWGYIPRGILITKEAHGLMIQAQVRVDPVWDRIWIPGIWPKVSTFTWLLYHKRILTWDNLIKRGFHGPSYCPNCKQQSETIQHLMDSWTLANKLWEKLNFRCQRACRISRDIISTIHNWAPAPYNSKLLNSLWTILLGLLLWTIWKERNKRIFKNQCTPLDIIGAISASTFRKLWLYRNGKQMTYPLRHRNRVFGRIGIYGFRRFRMITISLLSLLGHPLNGIPPTNVIKLNFDVASKGNPGKTGYGGIFRNHEGNRLLLYFGSIGWDTNNSAELEGLWQGLCLAHQHNFHPIIIEGDSQILINMATQIQQGSSASKVATSWRLAARLELIEKWLKNKRAITFNHVRERATRLFIFWQI